MCITCGKVIPKVVQTLSFLHNQDDCNVLWLQPQRIENKFKFQLQKKCVVHPKTIYARIIV